VLHVRRALAEIGSVRSAGIKNGSGSVGLIRLGLSSAWEYLRPVSLIAACSRPGARAVLRCWVRGHLAWMPEAEDPVVGRFVPLVRDVARAVSSPLKEVAMLRVGLILPASFHVMSYATLATFDTANFIAGEQFLPHVPDTVPGKRVTDAGARTEGRGQPSRGRPAVARAAAARYYYPDGEAGLCRPGWGRHQRGRAWATVAPASTAQRPPRGRPIRFHRKGTEAATSWPGKARHRPGPAHFFHCEPFHTSASAGGLIYRM
jgi:hypothetical protein